MNKRALLFFVVIGMILPAFTPSAQATSNYAYKPNEYVAITRGRSPDGVYSIAAHGEGDIGDQNFNLHLFDAKTGKKIGPLASDPENTWGADTLAGAYHANWSADSKSVTISYRTDRHTVSCIKLKIENKRISRLSGPTPITDGQAKEFGWPDLRN